MENAGKLDDLPEYKQHLRQVYDAVLEWLAWPDQQHKSFTLGYILKDESQRPDQPEPLAILHSLQNMNTSYWDGGFADQPYLLMLELQQCINAKSDYIEMQMKNLEQQRNFTPAKLPAVHQYG